MQRECKTRSKKRYRNKRPFQFAPNLESRIGCTSFPLCLDISAKVPTWQDQCEKRRSHLDWDFLVSSLFCIRNLIALTLFNFLILHTDSAKHCRANIWSITHSAVWYNIKSRLKMRERQKGCKQAISHPPRHLCLVFENPNQVTQSCSLQYCWSAFRDGFLWLKAILAAASF